MSLHTLCSSPARQMINIILKIQSSYLRLVEHRLDPMTLSGVVSNTIIIDVSVFDGYAIY